jgi:Cytochrome oxidase assembly protein.
MPRVADAKIFAMAFIGGIIRLAESGLSITEWMPTGAVILNWRGGFTRATRRPPVTQIVPPQPLSL